MPKFAANLSLMYPDLPFLQRFGQAARDGFVAVEFQFPYAYEPQRIAEQLAAHGLANVLFNLPPGEAAHDQRGLAALPGREDAFRRSVDLALSYALALGTPRLHVMAGVVPPVASAPERAALGARMHDTYVANLRFAAERFAEHGIVALIEPINTRDVPGYFINRQHEAHAVCHETGAPNLKVQMDLYHVQIVEGDVAMKLRRYLGSDDGRDGPGGVGHLQVAGVPERNEPDTGELNHAYLFDLIDGLGYDGWIGCEYAPRDTTPGGTSRGLGWMQRYR